MTDHFFDGEIPMDGPVFPAPHLTIDMDGRPQQPRELSRRSILRYAGSVLFARSAFASLATTFAVAGCSDPTDPSAHVTLDVSTELGQVNFSYALAQLEVDFYVRVVRSNCPAMTAAERNVLVGDAGATAPNLAAFQKAIASGRITDAVLFRTGQIVNLADRDAVISAAQTIADAAAQGYAGALAHVTTPPYVSLLTTMATTSAQRADAIRALNALGPISPVNPQSASDTMTTLAPFYLTTFSVRSA
jgi:hypothetical protein